MKKLIVISFLLFGVYLSYKAAISFLWEKPMFSSQLSDPFEQHDKQMSSLYLNKDTKGKIESLLIYLESIENYRSLGKVTGKYTKIGFDTREFYANARLAVLYRKIENEKSEVYYQKAANLNSEMSMPLIFPDLMNFEVLKNRVESEDIRLRKRTSAHTES